jgi:hypothetical protein
MYELIVTYKNSSYCITGDSTDLKDYPSIAIGSFVFIPKTGDIYYVYGPLLGFDLDGRGELKDNSTSSIFAEGMIGDMIFGSD